jgi:uncharacterized protein DUF1844
MSDQDFPLPPATFEFLIYSLKTQTEMHLGLIHFGDEKDRPAPDTRAARHSIDLLAMLQEKTRGNCTIEEQRLVDNSLTELRFRYVQALERQKAAESAAPAGDNKPDKTEQPPDETKEGQAGS